MSEAQSIAMLSVEDLCVSYGRALAIVNLSMSLDPGQLKGVVGPNGAGKTTLLLAISGLVPPSSGRIIWNGSDTSRMRPHQLVAAGIAHVPEGRRLFPDLSVLDNIRIGAIAANEPPEAHIDRVLDIFPALVPLLGRNASLLSGGEQQMVAIGRGLMANPQMLVVDELSLGLSPILADMLLEALARLASERNVAVLLVDQNIRLLQRRVDSFYLLVNGRGSTEVGRDALSELAVIDAYMRVPGRDGAVLENHGTRKSET